MLKPYQMSSVIITGNNNVLKSVIEELYRLKVLHIVEHSKRELADTGKPLENANRLSEILVRARALIAALGIKKEEAEFELKKGLDDIDSAVKKLGDDVSSNLDELKKTEELIAKDTLVKRELEILKDIDAPLESFAPAETLACFTGYVADKSKVQFLRKELPKITGKFMLFDSIAKKRSFIAVFADARDKESINAVLLRKAGFSPVNFVSISSLKGAPYANLKKIEEELVKLNKKGDEIKKNLDEIKNEHMGFLLVSEQFLSEQLEKAEAPLKFASTTSSFLIKGWVPTEELTATIDRLNKAAKNKIFIHFEPAKKEDEVPVKLKNPAYAKAFEFFIDLYNMPNYGEIDPTFFIFLTFPLFFGVMLGDIGYGVVSFLIFWVLKKKMPRARDILNILLVASVLSIFFGLLYGEFFGAEKILEFELPHLLSRVHDTFPLLYIAIAIGVVHVNIGLVIGFVNELKSHGAKHAIYAKASWIVLEIGVALLALAYLGKITISPLLGAAFIGISILMLLKGEGIKGLIELPSIFTNIISYARLMAIGLSSVILAVVVNDSSKEFFQKGGFFVLIGVFILIIGHAINIMLGLFGSFLHSLRLHYVEFFSKFFHGGAKKYEPFGAKNE